MRLALSLLVTVAMVHMCDAQWIYRGSGWPAKTSVDHSATASQSTPRVRHTRDCGTKDFTPCGDTFSIIAVDTVTREIGSAGASCIEDVIWISSPFPNHGVIHTQAASDEAQRNYARYLMGLGLSPQDVLNNLVAYDTPGYAPWFQYGVVDLVDGGRSAAYTGTQTTNWKGHLTGKTYAIQGNILLGPGILDSMKTRFLNTPGTMAERLMAAMQGAKVRGADTRCYSAGTSSISAFIRVVKPDDPPGGPYYLELNVDSMYTKEPIDSLQFLYSHLSTSAFLRIDTRAIAFPAIDINVPYRDTTIVVRNTGGKKDSVFVSLDYVNFTSDSAVSISPRVFELAPGATQQLKFRIRPKFLATGIYYNTVVMIDSRFGLQRAHFEKTMVFEVTGKLNDVGTSSTLPGRIALEQNYPNPFNPETVVRYQLPAVSDVRLAVYDMLGQEVSVLVNERKNAGVHEVRFDGSTLASGVYFYRLVVGNSIMCRTMVLMK